MIRPYGRLALLALIVVGCDDPTTTPAPHLAGEVSLYDELGHRLPSAGQVSVGVLTPSSVRQYQTFTDDEGRFQVELPDAESFDLMLSRDGFGDMFRYGVVQEREPVRVDMFARSSAAVTAASAWAESCGVLCLRLALEVDDFFVPGAGRRLFRIFLGTDPELKDWAYDVTDLLVVSNDQPGLVRTGDAAAFELDGLRGLLDGFPPGATVHVLVHGATENLTNSYRQPWSDLEIFTDLSLTSARTSFVMP
ncbi:MAG: hypothetical protein P8170_23525 [Gemmatimonadota bacterium]